MRSTALYPVGQQPHEAIQLEGMAKGRYIAHTPLRDSPFQLFLLQFLKNIGLQLGRSSLFSPSACRVGAETPFHCPENAELSRKADPSDVVHDLMFDPQISVDQSAQKQSLLL